MWQRSSEKLYSTQFWRRGLNHKLPPDVISNQEHPLNLWKNQGFHLQKTWLVPKTRFLMVLGAPGRGSFKPCRGDEEWSLRTSESHACHGRQVRARDVALGEVVCKGRLVPKVHIYNYSTLLLGLFLMVFTYILKASKKHPLEAWCCYNSLFFFFFLGPPKRGRSTKKYPS